MTIGIETCGPKIGSAAISERRVSRTSARLVASEISTSRVIRCWSVSPDSSVAVARAAKSRIAAISRSSASRVASSNWPARL